MSDDGEWQDSNELVTGNLIATEELEVSAGMAMVAGGMMPAVMVRATGVLAENVGVEDAERVTAAFLIPVENAERFARDVVTASKARPTG